MARKAVVRKKKDKFDKLPDEFKDAVAQSSVADIKKRIADIAILDCTMRATLKEDGEVVSAKEVLKNLMEPYREDLASYKLQIQWCKQVIDDKNGGAADAKG